VGVFSEGGGEGGSKAAREKLGGELRWDSLQKEDMKRGIKNALFILSSEGLRRVYD